MRLHVRDRYLKVYQKFKVGNVPILTQIVKDSVNNPLQANTDTLINKIQYYAGDYGIGDAATSLAWNNFADYFVDNYRGVVCRLAQDGITPLSIIYSTNAFFVKELAAYRQDLNNGYDPTLYTGNPCIYGVFDAYTNKYIIAMEEINRYSNVDEFIQPDEWDVFKILDTITLEECIKRDLKRMNSVGESVIKKMYKDFLKKEAPVRERNADLPDCIICDLDGTLCLFGSKNPYDRDFENDEPNQAVLDILNKYSKDRSVSIIFFSGRNDKYQLVTEMWLYKNLPMFNALESVRVIKLFMRKDGDFRKDSEIKKEMFMNNIEGKYNVRFILDDRNQVVDMWRNELGLTVFQVAEGDF